GSTSSVIGSPRAVHARTTSGVASVEPPSATTISSGRRVCSAMLANSAARLSASLRTVRQSATRPGSPPTPPDPPLGPPPPAPPHGTISHVGRRRSRGAPWWAIKQEGGGVGGGRAEVVQAKLPASKALAADLPAVPIEPVQDQVVRVGLVGGPAYQPDPIVAA